MAHITLAVTCICNNVSKVYSNYPVLPYRSIRSNSIPFNPRARMRSKGLGSWSVGRSVSLCVSVYEFFLLNHGYSGYQTWICGCVQQALGAARVLSGVDNEQRVYGARLNLECVNF